MNYDSMKKLLRRPVNLWPRPLVLPGNWRAGMEWQVMKVDARAREVVIQAPSGHFCNVADLIHHYQEQGDILVLDAQIVIEGDTLRAEPREWGETSKALRRHERAARLRALRAHTTPQATTPPPESPLAKLALFGLGVFCGAAINDELKRNWRRS